MRNFGCFHTTRVEFKMRTLLILPLLALTAAAAEDPAGWQAAKFGMSVEEVRAAMPAAQILITPLADRTIDGAISPLGIDRIEIAKTSWSVFFTFEAGKLTTVHLRPIAKTDATIQDFQTVEELLMEKYGRPFERQAGTPNTEWPIVRQAAWSFATTAITLRHVDLRPRVGLETLWLTYHAKLATKDVL